MKAAAILTSLILAAAVQAASSLPTGTFVGTGRWTGQDGTSGTYSVETSVLGQVLTSQYEYTSDKGARKESHAMRMAIQNGPFFDVLDDKDKVIGKGYCYDSQCSYRVETGTLVIQETLDFSKNSIHKFGSKSGPGFAVVWKEELQSK